MIDVSACLYFLDQHDLESVATEAQAEHLPAEREFATSFVLSSNVSFLKL